MKKPNIDQHTERAIALLRLKGDEARLLRDLVDLAYHGGKCDENEQRRRIAADVERVVARAERSGEITIW